MQIQTTTTTMTESQEYFDEYAFELSEFQKKAIEGIVDGKNVLITAHTGSGKTLPAEVAIRHWVKTAPSNKNKILYCSPIKALTNEKFYEFRKKFTNIEIGLITGDQRFNQDAQLILCTTEIMHNALNRQKNDKNDNIQDIKYNIYDELYGVIFDEFHYIMDDDRGYVWEESLIALKEQQIIGLSATLGNPEILINKMNILNKRKTILCSNNKRVVPLEHNILYFVPESSIKKLNTSLQDRIYTYDDCQLIKDENGYYPENFHNIVTIDNDIFKQNVYKSRNQKYYVMNEAIKHINNKNQTPAIVFVNSRKGCYDYANNVTIPLLNDNKMISTVSKRAINIIKEKIPNWKEYTELSEFKKIIKNLEKGIGVHHSGVTNIFREMIELLFKEKYIKIVFATESLGIGVNMPVKATIHTSLQKYSNNGFRYFHPHELSQMYGRGGRRGIDDRGYVYYLFNLYYKNPVIGWDKFHHMLEGKPPSLQSKFNINCDLIIRLIAQNKSYNDMIEFIKSSIAYENWSEEMIQQEVNKHTDILLKLNLITKDVETNNYITSQIGELASIINEIPSLSIASFICSESNQSLLEGLTPEQWVCILSIFTNIRLSDQNTVYDWNSLNIHIHCRAAIKKIERSLNYFRKIEMEKLMSGNEKVYDIQFNICELMTKWCLTSNYNECYKIYKEANWWGIFLGDFTKAILKINNIAFQLEKVFTKLEKIEIVHTLKQIPKLTLKGVTTNESIYI
jgi:superfamily II RNA helicase